MHSDFPANSGRFPPWTIVVLERQGLEPAASVGIIRAGLHQGQRHLSSMLLTHSSTTFSPQLCVRVSRISHCSILSACHPLARLAWPSSTALRPRSCARFRPSTAQRCATRRQHGGRRLPPCDAVLRAWWSAEGAHTHTSDVDVAHARAVVRRVRNYRRGARAVSSDEVSLQVQYKLGSLLSNVQVLPTLRLQATLVIEVAKAEESPSRLALWR
ncbi:hypothetical protein EDB86DRAFT_1555847 [Lactarius hatsudake]|nr:hypothetical protein EDB86DRAFT_1555847 [Lactarius hatsudake]